MRILLTAFALTFALPAAAQTGPAPSSQDGNHAQHRGAHHGGQHGQHHGQTGHDCCADGNGRPDGCDRMHSGQQGEPLPNGAQPDQHPQGR